MTVSLTGFMGCGKSSVGRRLAALLQGYEFIDLDSYIEDNECRSISSIIFEDGIEAFRTLESKYLKMILDKGGDTILSLGGGTVTTAECEEMVRSRTVCIYLKASYEELVRNLSESTSRPLLKDGPEKIRELLEARIPIYERVSHHIITTEGKYPMELAREAASVI